MEHFRRLSSSASTQGRTSPSNNLDSGDFSDAEDTKGPLGLNLISSPAEALVDFVFVHGLGGGSRKTWTNSKKRGLYWPKDLLAQDPNFSNARLYSFGYKADWQEMKDSILEIHDFALSLLGEMQDNPDIRKSSTKIVLIGHSMGGIVIKKLYMLARQDHTFGELASRIHSMYFLATPHRGSDMARTLNGIISLVLQKPYVSELMRNSSSIANINEGFREYIDDLQLWSFYETLPTKIGIIVDKGSATLGYENERVKLLNADHRGVCKFDSQSDPNYRTLRHALNFTLDTIVEGFRTNRKVSRSEIHSLSALTGVSDRPEDDLMLLDDTRMAGSCEWFTSKNYFIKWQSTSTKIPLLLWLSGNPGAGKSVILSHTIRYLEAQGLMCNYFFFKHSSSGKSSLGDCLRSLAFQMACNDESARSKLLSLEKDDALWDHGNERLVWRRLFLHCLFLTSSLAPQFWIIDALDECSNFRSIFPLLSRIPDHIRILISSRSMQDIENGFTGLGDLVLHQHIGISDTIDDIRLFIASRMDRLPVTYEQNKKALQDRISVKSAGSFLWVRLVVEELEHTFSEEAIDDVLNEVPQDMNQLYARILSNMTKAGRGANLTKAILVWSICASRPLSVRELQYALKLDINETVHNLPRSIASICGQLLFVDQSSRVQIVHQTARDFLLQQEEILEFVIHRKQCHVRLASICLQFLSEDCFKIQRFQSHATESILELGKSDDTNLKLAFADYACHFFSDHLCKSSSQDPSLLGILCSFLNKNVLSWIEYIAKTNELSFLALTANNIKVFLEFHTDYSPPISPEVEIIWTWITDLIRVTAKFRTQLVASPSSIYSLIPPLCPTDSIIARTYSTRQRGLLVKGLKSQFWDDCLARIDFTGAYTSAVSHGERLFAVGLTNNIIHLYDSISLQERCTFDHGERAKIIQFSNDDSLLASSGLHRIRLWNPTSYNQVWSIDTSYQAMAIIFATDNALIGIACRDNCIRTIKAVDHTEINCVELIETADDDFLEQRPCQSPSLMVFSSDCNMLAVSYRGRPILLFDVDNKKLPLRYSREVLMSPLGPTTHYAVDAIIFNPSPKFDLMIASYGDGELTVYNLWSAEPKHRLYDIFAHSLVCSPDGRSLVTGSSRGMIYIFDFGGSGDNLRMIYWIDTQEHGIKALAFSPDSLRYIDIRRSQCRIWEPVVLIRRGLDDDDDDELCQPILPLPKRTSVIEYSSTPEIMSICCHQDGKVVFCGRQDGSIVYYRTSDAGEGGILYSHAANVGIVALTLAAAQDPRLISVDESGRLLIKKISNEQGRWSECDTLADIRLNESITTLLINPKIDRLLTNGQNVDVLWDFHGNQIYKRESQEPIAVACHPLHPELFIALESKAARLFEWADFKEVTTPDGIILERLDDATTHDNAVLMSIQGSSFLVETCKAIGNREPNHFNFWQSSEFEVNRKAVTTIGGFEKLEPRIEHIIDVAGTILYFLDLDLWICSLDLRTFVATQQLKRHFFILSEWRTSTGRMLIRLTSRGDFVLAKQGEFVVVKRALEFSEIVDIS